jgi:hypothetical protein
MMTNKTSAVCTGNITGIGYFNMDTTDIFNRYHQAYTPSIEYQAFRPFLIKNEMSFLKKEGLFKQLIIKNISSNFHLILWYP